MILIDGEYCEHIPVNDRGLQYGDGAWETIAIQQGKPVRLAWHLERLLQGLAKLGIAAPDVRLLQQEITQVCASHHQAVLKLTITRGQGQRGYKPSANTSARRILQLSAFPEFPTSYTEQGIRLALCETRLAQQPLLAGFKHLNRLEQVLARAEFDTDFQEGLMCDYDGNVIEGTMSNLFIVDQNDQIHTPDLTQCGIQGIMRRFFIQSLADQGIQCHIHALTLSDVKQAKSLFMTNSLIGLWPVREFVGQQYEIAPLLRMLQAIDTQ